MLEHVLKWCNLFVTLCGRIGILPTFSLGPTVVIQCLLPTHPEVRSDWFGQLVFETIDMQCHSGLDDHYFTC